ncbi:MAG: hypothetical protein J5711_00525 [Bacteroidales bacterium]|nr:hypothetical protein [Bacteroidales bacterium]
MEDIRTDLSHKPIVYLDYEKRDEAGDAKILSVGRATWNNDCLGVKVWRKTDDGLWSRQSEDVPLWRVLDMAILLVATLKGQEKMIGGVIQDSNEKIFLDETLKKEMGILQCRLDCIKGLLNL